MGRGRDDPVSKRSLHNSFMSLNENVDRNSKVLAGLRIAIGTLFIIFGQYKVLGTQFTLEGGFESWIHRFLQDHAAYPFMIPVLQRFVLPHGTVIAFFVAYGELAIGFGLVLGFLARTASAFGLVYMLSLLFSSNYPGPHAAFWQYFGASLDHLVLALCFAAFLLGSADSAFSLRPAVRWLRRSGQRSTEG
jgi:thiosulfate dehydrogenase (quinone) large subunit